MNPRPTNPKPVALPNCATPEIMVLWFIVYGVWFKFKI